MRYTTIFAACLSFLWITQVFAQEEVQNGGLEEWDYDAGGDYYEPSGYWATANPLSKLSDAAPVTTFRESENVYAGEFAVKLVTNLLGTLPVTGTIYTGAFMDTEITDPTQAVQLGVPYTDKPNRINGYYMFFPVEQDSAAIALQLTKSVNGERVLIGQAAAVIYDEVDEYTLFDIPVEYFSEETPDSISIAFSASAGGQEFLGTPGTTLFIDEFAIEFVTGISTPIFPEIEARVYPNPASEGLHIETKKTIQGQVQIYNLQGKLILEKELNGLNTYVNLIDMSEGHYIYQIKQNNHVLKGGTFDVIK